MNQVFDDLLNTQKIQGKKEADTDFIKALEQRNVGIYTKRNNVPSYDLQVSAEDVLVKKEFKEMRCEMPGTPRSTFLMVFSPDGTKVASTHGNHNIYVTDVRSGKNIKTLVGHPRTPWCIAFHPTSNQILASGCLGGEVRIWDLSGGSEAWSSETQTVIASIAFHPDDRLLVIATYNELYFWDWSKPEPFMHVATGSIKEKVRYVAFDKLGHKLITGISNSPQTRWERVRAPVPVPRQADRAASPYRRRIVPRLISNIPASSPIQPPQRIVNREPLSTVPERERRITACYRNLVREYELLVHRYLQLYRPPTMIDQGTDPMEIDLSSITNSTQTVGPSTSGLQNSALYPNPLNLSSTSTLPWSSASNVTDPTPSTSGIQDCNTFPSSSSTLRTTALPKTISTLGTQTTSSTFSASRNSTTKSPGYNISSAMSSYVQCSGTPANSKPIDLSVCSTCDSSGPGVSNPGCTSRLDVGGNRQVDLTSESNRTDSNGGNSLGTRNYASATQSSEITPTISRDTVVLTPSEICSLRRTVRNFRSTQTQDVGPNTNPVQNNESIDDSLPSTSGMQNRNERRNSAPASTIYNDKSNGTGVLRKGESEERLPQNSATIRQYVNLTKLENPGNCNSHSKVMVVRPSASHNSPNLNSPSNSSKVVVIRSSASSNPEASNSTQTQSPRRLLIISTSLGKRTFTELTDGQRCAESSEDINNFKMRIRCSGSSPQNSVTCNRSGETRSSSNNVDSTSSANQQPSTSSQNPESKSSSNLNKLLHNTENLFSKCVVTHHLPKRCDRSDQNSNNESAAVPSELHINLREHSASQNVDKLTRIEIDPGSRCASGVNIQPENKNQYSLHEQARKRLYPGFSKKPSRRPILDSSSDTSSSDEDDRSKRHMSSPRIPSSNVGNFYFKTGLGPPKPAAPDSSSISQLAQENSYVPPVPVISEPVAVASSTPTRRPLNFNTELEMLVTDLLANSDNSVNSGEPSANVSVGNQSSSSHSHNLDRVCGTCGGSVEDQNRGTAGANHSNPDHCARTNDCPRNTVNTCTRTTNTTVYTSPSSPRRRFFSHQLSAFYPTRIQNLRSCPRLRRSGSFLSPFMRNRLRCLNTLQGPNRLPALDEVINYSERVSTEEELPEPSAVFHPFDPPPEFATINPENIGIGNMYSNIVQELESSLNDVRNIRASNRLGETSDMLSSFSERLESIMNQSNAILRNLRTSIDTLTPADQNVLQYSPSYEPRQPPFPPRSSEPQLLFNDRSFYLRERENVAANENSFGTNDSSDLIDDSNADADLFSNHSAVAADHTYPLNSRNPQSNTNNMTPLMASLHLTVSHIQRQARLLRQQVESIERIDRAMLEVAQLQMLRQLFAEIQRYIRVTPSVDNRNAVSSVRQMMAGTRISDSSPYDSPNEETSNENQHTEPGPSTVNQSTNSENQNNPTQNRCQNRKTYPRCIFLMHRNVRRGSGIGNMLQRRYLPRERYMRRNLYRRPLTFRSLIPRTAIDLSTGRSPGIFNQPSSDGLRSITRRLEHFLMEHGRHIGRVVESTGTSALSTDRNEYIMMLRLNHCRSRVSRLLGYSDHNSPNIRRQNSSVTADGLTRFGARDMLTSAADALSRYIENGIPNTPCVRSLIWDVVDLSVLLSEILLLQIVDSIPPPTGMNLDPERESLSARIDQMCSRMLQSRLSGHSQQLTRSLRLTRVAVRHASRALDQTYTARRNAMLPSGSDRDQRRELLEEINNCLRNIRRHHTPVRPSTSSTENASENLSMREWFRTIHGHISRYTDSSLSNDEQPSTSSANVNAETGEQSERPPATSTTYEQISSDDDDNEPDWYNNNNNNNSSNVSRDRLRPLYRTSNVNLLHSEESSSANSRNRPWNVPTVQVNDVPISQYQSQWHQRFLANRQRLSDRLSERVSELRSYTLGGLFRPRFLHPLYAGVNPFDADLDDSTREQIYDSDIIATVTPNHRIQVWEFSSGIIPNINNALENVVVNECKIHNDASVDIATDGSILVTLLPSGGYLNVTNRLGVYSLEWESLGQCLYIAAFEQNAVSVSLSPLSRHLVVGLASRRVSIMPSDKWTMARIFMLDERQTPCTQLSSVREVEQHRDPTYMSVNCIRWLPLSGQGLVYATNTGQLRVLT